MAYSEEASYSSPFVSVQPQLAASCVGQPRRESELPRLLSVSSVSVMPEGAAQSFQRPEPAPKRNTQAHTRVTSPRQPQNNIRCVSSLFGLPSTLA